MEPPKTTNKFLIKDYAELREIVLEPVISDLLLISQMLNPTNKLSLVRQHFEHLEEMEAKY